MSYVAAAIAGSALVVGSQSRKARKSAEFTAREQERLAIENENRRIAEAQQQAAVEQQRYNAEQARMAGEAARVRQAEERRQQNIAAGQNEISSAFGQFNDDFYGTRMKSYLDYATPQLDKQYQDQLRSLTASLARSGNLNSSLRGELMGKLQQEYNKGKLTIADQARSYTDQTRAAANAARARLMETNMSLADPGVIRGSALADASRLTANPQFASLGNLLSDLSGSLGNGSGAQTTANSTGSGVGLFNPSLGGTAGRLVN
jgi:hypothetical protein